MGNWLLRWINLQDSWSSMMREFLVDLMTFMTLVLFICVGIYSLAGMVDYMHNAQQEKHIDMLLKQ